MSSRIARISLSDLVEFQRGFDLPESERIDGNVPVVASRGISGFHNQSKVKGPGVVIGRSGSIGGGQYISDDYWPLNTTLWVKDFRGNNPRFVYYVVRNINFEFLNAGAGVPTLNRNHLRSISIPRFDVDSQERISCVLGQYDDLIENNHRRIQLLEESARLLYREWFVHLRFPGHEHVRIVDGIPEEWRVSSFGEVSENLDRYRIPLSVMEREQRQGEIPYHGASGILDYIDDYLFDGRYLLIGEDGTVIKDDGTPMLQLVQGRVWVSNHAHVIRGRALSTEYLYCLMSQYQISPHVTGVAQPKITQKNLNRISVLIPPRALQNEFQCNVEPLIEQIFTLKELNKKLAQSRDLLLPRLVNGEIAV